MARARIPLVIIDTDGIQANVPVTVTKRATGAVPAVYTTEGGNGTLPQPLISDDRGRVPGWLDRGAYQAVFVAPGKAQTTEYFDIAPAGDATIDTDWLAGGSTTEAKYGDQSVDARVIQDGAVTTVKIQDGSITLAKLAAGVGVGGGGSAVTMDTWHLVGGPGEPVFQNSWKNYSVVNPNISRAPVGFRKFPDGTVRLKGQMTGGASGTAFTLPAGYRPANNLEYVDATSQLGGMDVVIFTDGTVQVNGDPVYLDGIVFDTESVTSYYPAPTLPMDTWHVVGNSGEPAFQNAWANDTAAVTKFRKYPDGKVRLEGRIRSGNFNTVAFTLPVGYRPTQLAMIPVAYNDAVNNQAAEVRVNTDGTVKALFGSSSAVPGNYVSLEGVEFDTEVVSTYGVSTTLPMDTMHYVGGTGEPAFSNSWTNYDATDSGRQARFRKFPDGKVKLAGCIKGGATGTVAFTLPAAYRPANLASGTDVDFSVIASGGTGVVQVYGDGRVLIANTASSNVTSYVYLDGIEFDTGSNNSYVAGWYIPPLVTALPGNPVDGQIVDYLADAANGVVWRLRYRAASSSAYKWEFIGGGSLEKEQVATETSSSFAATTWGSVSANDPQLTVPLAGDYIVRHAAVLSAPTTSTLYLGLKIGATEAAIAQAAWVYNSPGQVTGGLPISHTRKLTGVAAATLIAQRYYTSNAQSGFSRGAAHMEIVPVRVG
jgi:hypothetical protein